MWGNYKQMPPLLKFFTALAVFSFVFFAYAVIQLFSFAIGSKYVSDVDWRSVTQTVVWIITGIVMPISGYMLLTRNRYARILYISFMVFVTLCQFFISGLKDESAISIILAIAQICVISAYMYLNKSVKLYFNSSNDVS